MKRKIICVVGPTASGKTSLAVFLARKLNAEIISADSRQIYRKLDIGTGKDLKDYNGIKYHLIDICNPQERFTLFDWLDLARKEIEKLFERDIVPIIVGGTGLYVQALVEGFENINQKPKAKLKLKTFSRERLDQKSLEELQKIYSQFTTHSSQLDINNPRRLIRAIELAQEGIIPSKQKPDFDVLQIGITLDREELYKKIDKRVEEWFEEGFLDEVKNLLEEGISPEWLNEIGLEYRIMAKYLSQKNQNVEELDKTKQEMKFAIHHYARRQLTWFRRFKNIIWVQDKRATLQCVKKFLK